MVFVLLTARSPDDLTGAVRLWRRRFFGPRHKGRRRKVCPQEYHDIEATGEQRAFILEQLVRDDARAWAVLKQGYHPREYPYVVADLLLASGVVESDRVLLDERDDHRRRAEYRRIIHERTGIQDLQVEWARSLERKELQACDALAGAIGRGWRGLPESCVDITMKLLVRPLLILPPDQYRHHQEQERSG